jgi:hypothetical protein
MLRRWCAVVVRNILTTSAFAAGVRVQPGWERRRWRWSAVWVRLAQRASVQNRRERLRVAS